MFLLSQNDHRLELYKSFELSVAHLPVKKEIRMILHVIPVFSVITICLFVYCFKMTYIFHIYLKFT